MGTSRSDDGDGNDNVTKAIGLLIKTSILHVHHAFLYISLPSLYDYDVKMSNFTLYRGKYTSDDEISSLFLNLDMVLRNSTLEGFAMKTERTRIHFFSDVFSAVAVLGS